MNQTTLETLQRLYSEDKMETVILDKDWNVIWSSCCVEGMNFLALLRVPKDYWENVRRPVIIGMSLFHCEILSNEEDGFRVLRLQEAKNDIFDKSAFTDVLQAMISTCTAMTQLLQDMDVNEFTLYPNQIMANTLRIYRMVFMEREIRRGLDGAWERSTFDGNAMMAGICRHMQNLLRQFAEVNLRCDSSPLFIIGDVRGFQCMVLTAYLLCVRHPEMNQTVNIRMQRGAMHSVLTIKVKHGKRKRVDLAGQMHNFGNMEPEKLLLAEYCRYFCLKPEFKEDDEEMSFRVELENSQDTSIIQMSTTASLAEQGYFNLPDVLLSRLRYRDFSA